MNLELRITLPKVGPWGAVERRVRKRCGDEDTLCERCRVVALASARPGAAAATRGQPSPATWFVPLQS